MKLAELFVQITGNAAPLTRTLAQVHSNLTGFASRAGRTMVSGIASGFARNAQMLVGGAELAAVGIGGGLVAGFVKASQGASDLAEEISKVEVVFGKSAGVVKSTAQQMADDFGIPKKAILQAASNIGLIGKGAGFTEDKAADLGSTMAKLAVDASSFYNVPVETALEKIRSGLVGEAEPLRQFGVLLSETAVKSEAVRAGLAKQGAELTESQKVQARVLLIQKGLADATGDLARTQGGAANQTRQFWGQLENLRDTIGAELLPYFTKLIKASNDFVTDFSKGFEESKDKIAEFKKKIDDALFVIKNMGTVFQVARLDVAIQVSKMIDLFGDIKSKWTSLVDYIRANPLDLLPRKVDVKRWAGDIIGEFTKKALGGLVGDKVKFDMTKMLPKELRDVAPLVGPLGEESEGTKGLRADREKLINDLAKKRAAELAAAGGAPPEAGPEKKPKPAEEPVKKPAREQQAAFMDLAGFAKKLQEGAFGKDSGKETARWTEMTARGVQQLVEGQNKPKPTPPIVV